MRGAGKEAELVIVSVGSFSYSERARALARVQRRYSQPNVAAKRTAAAPQAAASRTAARRPSRSVPIFILLFSERDSGSLAPIISLRRWEGFVLRPDSRNGSDRL